MAKGSAEAVTVGKLTERGLVVDQINEGNVARKVDDVRKQIRPGPGITHRDRMIRAGVTPGSFHNHHANPMRYHLPGEPQNKFHVVPRLSHLDPKGEPFVLTLEIIKDERNGHLAQWIRNGWLKPVAEA